MGVERGGHGKRGRGVDDMASSLLIRLGGLVASRLGGAED